MGEGDATEERSGQRNRAEQQRAEQVGANEDGLPREPIDPYACKLANDSPSNEIDRGKGGRLGCIDAEANDGEEGEGSPGDKRAIG